MNYRRIIPSKLGAPRPGPERLGSTFAVVEALPEGAWLIVPADWMAWANEHGAAKRLHVISDAGGIHGSISDIPRGAVVGVGQGAYGREHDYHRSQCAAILTSGRFDKVLWA